MTPNPDILIGGRVRQLREQRGVTQAVLGQRIGVTFQQVQKYERGVNRIAASRLIKIAECLDCTPANLLAGPTPADDPVAEMASTPSGRAMAEAWALMPPHVQQSVLNIARAAGVAYVEA
jgi:transcriptional regulator with XRE-family HTH domain